MQYFGGKTRIAARLCGILQPAVDSAGSYVEPFVGGASVIEKIKCSDRTAGDSNVALISMWRAISSGWSPPDSLSESDYAALRSRNDSSDPMTAFAGIGCSFSGKWFGGYARNQRGDNYARAAARTLTKSSSRLSDVKWEIGDYKCIPTPDGAVIYCDPPYVGTTQYTGAPDKFDWSIFWDWCREKAKTGSHVFISEYRAPDDAICVAEFPTRLEIRNARDEREHRIQRLFEYRP